MSEQCNFHFNIMQFLVDEEIIVIYTQGNRVLTILACSGRVLRILEHCRVRQTVELDSVPTTLHVPRNVLGDRILCGFADGKISMFSFGHFSGDGIMSFYK